MEQVLKVYIDNLRVLAKLQVGHKLTSNGLDYGFSTQHWLIGDTVSRTLRGDGGQLTVDFLAHDFDTIQTIVDLTFESLEHVTSDVANSRLKALATLYNAINHAMGGLDNMCGTYTKDPLIRPEIRDLYNVIEARQKKLHDMLIEKECELDSGATERRYV